MKSPIFRMSQMRPWCVPTSLQTGEWTLRQSTSPTSPSLVPQQTVVSLVAQRARTSCGKEQLATGLGTRGSVKLRQKVLETATRFSFIFLTLQMLVLWACSVFCCLGRSQVMSLFQLPASSFTRSSQRSIERISLPSWNCLSSLKKSVLMSSVICSSVTSNSLMLQSSPRVMAPKPEVPAPFLRMSKMQASCNLGVTSKGCSGLIEPWLEFQKLMLPQRLPTSRYLSITLSPQAPSFRTVLISSYSSFRPQTFTLPLELLLLSTMRLLHTNSLSLRAASFLTSKLGSWLMKRMRDSSLPVQSGLLQVSPGRKEGSRSISHLSFSRPNLEIWFLVFLYNPMTLPLISLSWLCANLCSSLANFSPSGWARNSFSLFLAVAQMGLNLATHQITSLKCVRVITYSWSLWSLISMASSTILEVSERASGLAMGSMMGGAVTAGGSMTIGSGFLSRSPSLYSKRRSGCPCRMVHCHLSSAMALSSVRSKVISAWPFLTSILSGPTPRSRWLQMASGVWKVKGALIMIIDLPRKRLQSLSGIAISIYLVNSPATAAVVQLLRMVLKVMAYLLVGTVDNICGVC